MSRRDGDKNWIEEALSKVTERMWNTDDYGGNTEERGMTNRHERMTKQEAEELKRYMKDPKRYVNDTRFKILEQKLRYQNERTAEGLDESGGKVNYSKADEQAAFDRIRRDREERERNQDL